MREGVIELCHECDSGCSLRYSLLCTRNLPVIATANPPTAMNLNRKRDYVVAVGCRAIVVVVEVVVVLGSSTLPSNTIPVPAFHP